MNTPPTTERAWNPTILPSVSQYQSVSGTRVGDSWAQVISGSAVSNRAAQTLVPYTTDTTPPPTRSYFHIPPPTFDLVRILPRRHILCRWRGDKCPSRAARRGTSNGSSGHTPRWAALALWAMWDCRARKMALRDRSHPPWQYCYWESSLRTCATACHLGLRTTHAWPNTDDNSGCRGSRKRRAQRRSNIRLFFKGLTTRRNVAVFRLCRTKNLSRVFSFAGPVRTHLTLYVLKLELLIIADYNVAFDRRSLDVS